MDFFEVIKKRRSIRKFKSETIPDKVIEKALEAAILAPNSSNAQTWDFYWLKSTDLKKAFIKICLNQSAARTAAEIIVVVARPHHWKRSHPELVKWVTTEQAPNAVILYYKKFFPLMYKSGPFNFFGFIKKFFYNFVGLFRPIMRGPSTLSEIQEVAIKSAALAAENFVLAITAQGYASCMMEGFDEPRAKKALHLNHSDRIVMIIAVGAEAENGTWAPQFRLPLDQVVHRI